MKKIFKYFEKCLFCAPFRHFPACFGFSTIFKNLIFFPKSSLPYHYHKRSLRDYLSVINGLTRTRLLPNPVPAEHDLWHTLYLFLQRTVSAGRSLCWGLVMTGSYRDRSTQRPSPTATESVTYSAQQRQVLAGIGCAKLKKNAANCPRSAQN